MEKIYLSVVIPCYNEAQNIKMGKINKVLNFLNSKNYNWEAIIVDDGSVDASRELIKKIIKKEKRVIFIENPHQGKALTVITGMLRGKGEFILFTDLDQATPIEEIDKFLPILENNYDIVIGSRQSKRHGAPFIRAIMGPGFTFVRKIILGLDQISDTQCGFKAFKKDVCQQIFKRLQLYKKAINVSGSQVTAGFDVELLFLAQKLGYKIKEIPVSWNYVETRRVNPLRDSLLAFVDLLRIRWNSLRGFYSS